MARNVGVKVDGDILTLTVNIKKRLKASASGKNVLVATSEGNMDIEGVPGMKAGINIFVPADKKKKGEED